MSYAIKGNPNRSLTGTVWGFFVGLGSVALFSTIVKELQAAGVSEAKAALLISIPTLTGALLRIPFAAWTETNGGKKPFMVLLILSCIGLLGVSAIISLSYDNAELLAQNYPLLLLFGCIAGCGGATFSVGVAQTSYWFKKNVQGSALAIFGGYGNMGPGIFTLLLTWILLPFFGMLKTYYIWSVFLILGTILYYYLADNAWYFQLLKSGKTKEEAKKIASEEFGQEIFPAGTIKEALMTSAKEWKIWVLVFVYTLSFGGFLAVTSWLPKYFQFYHNVESLPIVGLLAACFSLGASTFRAVLGGPLSDKHGGRLVTLQFLVVASIGFLVLMFTAPQNLWMATVGIVLAGLGLGVVNASIFKLVPKFCPNAVGGASGWVGGIGALGGFLFPNILGAFVASYGLSGYASGFSVLLGWGIVSFLMIFALTKKGD